MTMDPRDDLQLFLEDAFPPAITVFHLQFRELEDCDRDAEARGCLLKVEHNSIRKLVAVQLAPRLMKRLPIEFCAKYIPTSGSQFATQELPPLERFSGLFSDIFSTTTNPRRAKGIRVSTVKHIIKAMDPVMVSAAQVMSTVWPEETKGYSFVSLDKYILGHVSTRNHLLCRVAAYQKELKDEHQLDTTHKLMMFCFAPWALTNWEISCFSTIQENLPFRASADEPSYNKSQRVWAKIWDTCAQNRCPYFVVTNTHVWVFGWFLAGWTRAIVSDIVNRTDKAPSVMQCLTYWLASTMEIKGAFKRPISGFSAQSGNPDVNDHGKIGRAKEEWSDGLEVIKDPLEPSLATTRHPNFLNVWITDFGNPEGS